MSPTNKRAPIALLAGSTGLLGLAFGFQYVGDLQPCALCLYQRFPHAIVIVLTVLAIFLSHRKPMFSWLMILTGLTLLMGGGIAGFHVGVEQHWWKGTAECGSSVTPTTLEALRAQIMSQPVQYCDRVSWTLFGISMAGYNLIFSASMALFAFVHVRNSILKIGRCDA